MWQRGVGSLAFKKLFLIDKLELSSPINLCMSRMNYLITLFCFSLVFGQEEGSPVTLPEGADKEAPSVEGETIQDFSLESQIVVELFKQIQEAKANLGDDKSPQFTKNLEKLSELEADFEKSVVGEEVVELYSDAPPQSSLEEEFMNILQPIFGAVKETTASLREKEDLRLAIEKHTEQQKGAQKALESIEEVVKVSQSSSPEFLTALEVLQSGYQSKANLSEARKVKLQETLDSLKSQDVNAMGNASEQFAAFIKSTGMHLLIAFLVAGLVFFGANYAFKKLMEYSKKNADKAKFNYEYLATVDGAVFLGSLVVAILLIPIVFLLCENWFLISIFALLAIITFWMLKDKIPDLVEELRLILNIGAVREQERIIHEGLPWIVDEIKFYTRLVNPNLEGGRLRIPLGDLVGMYSRSFKEDEPYFPTKKGDWVLLEDDVVGEITRQTIENITLKQVGGSVRNIPTPAFLEMNPVNLSENGFRASVNFGIDYKYQAQATTEIEKKLEDFMKAEMLKCLEDESQMKDFFIEFAEAGPSALIYEINAEFSGAVAPLYLEIPCYLQRFALDACNEYGWEIPFTQIKIHT